MYLTLKPEKADALQRMVDRLDPRIADQVLESAIFDTANELENEATENLRTRIYGRPPSPRYRRTGNALGGRVNEAMGNLKRRIRFNSTIKGATKNYTPFLNKNKRIRFFNTFFWTDAKKNAQKNGREILRKYVLKRFMQKV